MTKLPADAKVELVARAIANATWDKACSALGTPNFPRGSDWETWLHAAQVVVDALQAYIEHPLARMTRLDEEQGLYDNERIPLSPNALEQSDAEQEQGMGVPFGTGSRASHEALRSSPEASIPNAVDTARRILRDDAYLVSYLLGWCGLGKAEPWGAAMSFALEVAHGYGLIRGESDSTPTEFGAAVAAAFEEASAIDARQSQDGATRLGPKGKSAAPQEDAHTPQVDKG